MASVPYGLPSGESSLIALPEGKWLRLALKHFERNDRGDLPLGELEAPARLGLAVLLALHHARIAGEEAAALEHRAQIGLMSHQCLGQAVTHRARLTRQPAAGDGAYHVVLTLAVGGDEWLLDQHAQHRAGKIGLHRPAVDPVRRNVPC